MSNTKEEAIQNLRYALDALEGDIIEVQMNSPSLELDSKLHELQGYIEDVLELLDEETT